MKKIYWPSLYLLSFSENPLQKSRFLFPLALISVSLTSTPALILSTLNLSADADRSVLGFHKWVSSSSNFEVTDEIVSYFVDYFGRWKDFKSSNEVLAGSRGTTGAKTLEASIDRLVRAGRPTQGALGVGPDIES